ncbi:MAG: hypothetical protein J0L93_10255 [Deltaproteobacteria bacterium]|nr:hypothetical protein [Deltaproteobacteria bacterium]
MKKIFSHSYFALGSLLLLASACGGSLDIPQLQTESATASATHFSQTLYPILKDRCSSCHATTQAPFFALPNDIQSSFNTIMNSAGLVDFDTPQLSRIYLKVQGGHNCWNNCSTNSDSLLQAIQNWKTLNVSP